jgi:osmotically-inducible protein OsmY
MAIYRHFHILVILPLVVALSGCAAAIVGGAAGGAVVASDSRTTGSYVEDKAIQLKAGNLISKESGLAQGTRINVYSYNQQVLVTGQAHNDADKTRVLELVRSVEKVRLVRDYITVGPASSLGERSRDTLLEAQVRTALVGLEEFDFTRVEIICEQGVTYLMGILGEADGKRAAQAASTVSGVRRVVALFEFTKG